MALDIDLNDIDPNMDAKTLRKSTENGGLVPPGKYHAALIDSAEKAAGQTTINELDFKILHGPHAGSVVKAKLWNTDKPANRKRHLLFRLALGMVAKKGDKYVALSDHYDDAAASQVSVVIDVEHVSYTKKDSDVKGFSAEVKFNGIYAETDPEAAAVPRNKSAIRSLVASDSGPATATRTNAVDL
jgi:hypothetical protein